MVEAQNCPAGQPTCDGASFPGEVYGQSRSSVQLPRRNGQPLRRAGLAEEGGFRSSECLFFVSFQSDFPNPVVDPSAVSDKNTEDKPNPSLRGRCVASAQLVVRFHTQTSRLRESWHVPGSEKGWERPRLCRGTRDGRNWGGVCPLCQMFQETLLKSA